VSSTALAVLSTLVRPVDPLRGPRPLACFDERQPRNGTTRRRDVVALRPGSALHPHARDRSDVGLIVGLLCTGFILALRAVTKAVWPDGSHGHGFLDGQWWMAAILVLGGAVVGVTRKLLHTPFSVNMFAELEEGRVDPSHVGGVVVTGFVSLASGASLGPEAPLATLGGGIGTKVAERSGRDARVETFAGMSAAFGGLLGLPLFATALALELEHPRRIDYYRLILPGLLASAVGTGVFLTATDHTFLGLFDLGPVEFRWWHMAIAVPLGAVGALLAVLCALLVGVMRKVLAPLANHVVLLPVVGGAIMGLVALVLPLTLFSGEHEFGVALAESDELGGWLLLAVALAKLLTLATAMSTGFVGGPIFPMLFAGGTVGLCVHSVFPGVPTAIAVSCVMAATPGAFASVPVSMLVVVLVLVGSGPAAAPAAVAVVVAFSLTYGLGLFPPRPTPDTSRNH
jgi:H+/Cl- antiporter ClcA